MILKFIKLKGKLQNSNLEVKYKRKYLFLLKIANKLTQNQVQILQPKISITTPLNSNIQN